MYPEIFHKTLVPEPPKNVGQIVFSDAGDYLSRLLPKVDKHPPSSPGPLDPGYVVSPSLEGLNMIKDEGAFYVTRFLPEPSKKATIDNLVPKGPGTKGKKANESSKRAAQKVVPI